MSHSVSDGDAIGPERRIALIMVNSFSGVVDDRTHAAEYNYKSMMSLWRDTLGCEIYSDSGKDLTAQQMRTALRNFSNIQEHFKYVAVVISTYGDLVAKSFAEHPQPIVNPNDFQIEQKNGYKAYMAYTVKAQKGEHDHEPMIPVFFGNDYLPVREKEMKELFYNNSAEGLQDIPKIFILDYSRGCNIDYGVIRVPRPTSAPRLGRDDRTLTQPPDSRPTRDHEIQPPSILPLISDGIAIYGSHESTAALQYGPDIGSWLISEIKSVFEESAEDDDLLRLLTQVNKNMKNKTGSSDEMGQRRYLKAMSVFESSLTTKVYLK